MEVLETVRSLDLPDCRLVAGAVYQSVWNSLTNRPHDHGVKDWDLAYFDASDLSWEAEDQVIRRVRAAFPESPDRIEVRNQARVHLWFERRFGIPYAPLGSTTKAWNDTPLACTRSRSGSTPAISSISPRPSASKTCLPCASSPTGRCQTVRATTPRRSAARHFGRKSAESCGTGRRCDRAPTVAQSCNDRYRPGGGPIEAQDLCRRGR